MAETDSQRRTGIALVIAAAVAWSTAPFFTRLLPVDSWTILFWRGLFGGGLIATVLVLTQGRAGLRDLAMMGKSGWLVASLSTLGMVSFIPALQLTSVSNVAIIIAAGPFVAAALAWIWLREAARLRFAGKPCGFLRRRHYRRQCARWFRYPGDRPGLPHDCCDRSNDGRGPATQEHTDGGCGGIVECPGQHCQHSLRPRNSQRDRSRAGHPCDVRILPGRVGSHFVCPRLPSVAVRAGVLDRYPGDTADAVLGMAGVPGGSCSPGSCRRRLGDGGRLLPTSSAIPARRDNCTDICGRSAFLAICPEGIAGLFRDSRHPIGCWPPGMARFFPIL